MEEIFADPTHPVFNLVPPRVGTFISKCYIEVGQPEVTRQSAWNVYSRLLQEMRAMSLPGDVADALMLVHVTDDDETAVEDGDMLLSHGLQELPFGCDAPDEEGNVYLGGLADGFNGYRDVGSDAEEAEGSGEELPMEYVEFTDREDVDDSGAEE